MFTQAHISMDRIEEMMAKQKFARLLRFITSSLVWMICIFLNIVRITSIFAPEKLCTNAETSALCVIFNYIES